MIETIAIRAATSVALLAVAAFDTHLFAFILGAITGYTLGRIINYGIKVTTGG